ncbi:hypothetical protein OIDMADRAFT_137280 [Oidiodendron maius Zn]|uniref:F-box domain-containing protein n=1 Tax=Oidiodendron maius (strain Zn) TaxID=913774 RepID=A0A0C3CVD8_OIDMZ|nr:hypothetical protein OIDMADRAFT_137280 [Oidiodendron maius Zn]
MGYSEIHCQLCGVSSNIGRIRKADEPLRAAWSSHGFRKRPIAESYVEFNNDPDCPDCSEDWPDSTPNGGGDDRDIIFPPDRRRIATLPIVFTEHGASLNCINKKGYNGHYISQEEMRTCGTIQCLVPKDAYWMPQADDEEFESLPDTEYFLSGLCDHFPSRDDINLEFCPPRHNHISGPVDNMAFEEWGAANIAMPFHPACLEVFKRAAKYRFGRVSIKLLTDWFRLEADWTLFNEKFPRHESVIASREQFWIHSRGDEWLAANPLFIPILDHIFGDVTNKEDTINHLDNGVFALGTRLATHDQHTELDIFQVLGTKFCHKLLNYLDPRDVANLRLVTPAFLQLPQSFFLQLISQQMPWLWEVWCQDSYPKWARYTARELWEDRQRWEQANSHGEERVADISPWNAQEAQKQLYDDSLPQPVLLEQTNWYRLYSEIREEWGRLHGLRNRERIWKDCNYILDRIEYYCQTGKMGEGIVVDPVESFLARQAASSLNALRTAP